MAAHQFRSALNGFNREDVVRYIEYLNSVHNAEMNQLRSELEYLRTKQSAPAPVEKPAENGAESEAFIEQQAIRIRELYDSCQELEKQLAEANEAKKHAEEKLQAVLTQQKAVSTNRTEELEAYRRAERMERQAKERAENMERQAKARAEHMHQQTNAAIADASLKVDEVADQIGQLSEVVNGQLALLQDAVVNSKLVLKDAANIMYGICPKED